MATKTNQPTPSREYKELTARFEALCDEQERLYNPNFEAVFQALFQLDDEQRAIYNTGFWNMGALPSKPDEQLISQALKQAGFDGDSDFCKAFLRYASLIIEGKQVQQAGLIQNLKELPTDEQPTPSTAQRPIDVKGWKFKPMAIVAPVEFHKLIIETLFECANLTDIPTESIDEFLDELANREAFNVRCSLTPYIDALKRCRVILDNGSFFDREKTRLLFVALKKATDSMKANTDKPGTVKADIANLIKGFDGVPVWGLFFQILILQGLCDVFERLDINEGDTGYYEAQSLYNWIVQQLIGKEAVFCCLPYGETDLKRLEPFCEYLLSTSVGQWVQACLFGSDEQPTDEQTQVEQPATLNAQPDIMTDRAKKYFAKAIQAGFMEQTGNGYKWVFRNGLKAALCYFIMKVYSPDIADPKPIPYKALEKLFDVARLDSALSAMLNAKKPQEWRGDIDGLFND